MFEPLRTDIMISPEDSYVWNAGVEGTPRPGDLWVLAWDGTDIGAVIVAAVRDTYLLAWPITNQRGDESSPAFLVPSLSISTALAAWPHAEFGMSNVLLSRRIENVLGSEAVHSFRRAIRGGEDPPIQTFQDRVDEQAIAAVGEVVQFAQAVGDFEWPGAEVGSGVFNTVLLGEFGLNARMVHELAGGPPGQVAELFTGERSPTLHQATAVAHALGLLVDEVLTATAAEEADALTAPGLKSSIVELSARRRISEREARNLVLTQAQMAARQAPGIPARQAAADRVEAALSRLLAGSGG